MPRILLALVACLLAFGPQRVCACAAAPCADTGCPLTETDGESGHHHDGDHDESGHHPGHRHHDQDCPAVATASVPALAAPDPTSVGAPDFDVALSPADVLTDPAFRATCAYPLCPPSPHVPLHVSLQVFRN